jgi:hypothetical protein
MPDSEAVYKRIAGSGIEGIRRVDLEKRHGPKVKKNIQELLEKGTVFTDKKKGAVTYWTKENYLQYLVNNKVSGLTSELDKRLTAIRSDISQKVAGMVAEAKVATQTATKIASQAAQVAQSAQKEGNGGHNGKHMTLDQFKMEFDRTMATMPTAIGWVELGIIRENICGKYSISKQDFYSLASQLFDQFNSGYELSSGGSEGVVVRGLVHGFVRRI